MGKFVTMNYSGSYEIEPRRAVDKDAAGQTIYSDALIIRPVKMGMDDKAKRPVGIFDTETMLTQDQKDQCERRWGKDWLKILDDKIEKGPANLRLLRPGEVITVNDIDIQAVNPSDKARLPKSKRATVIQGPITAGTMGTGVPSARLTVDKVEEKMLPGKREKAQE